jgi:hypothetical protein
MVDGIEVYIHVQVIGVQTRLEKSSCRAKLIIMLFPFLQALPGQQTPDGVPSFKLVLVGDGGTGKRVQSPGDRCPSGMEAVEKKSILLTCFLNICRQNHFC